MNEPLNFVEEKISRQHSQQPMTAAQLRAQLKAAEEEEKRAARVNKSQSSGERDVVAVIISVIAVLTLIVMAIGIWAIWYAQVFVK